MELIAKNYVSYINIKYMLYIIYRNILRIYNIIMNTFLELLMNILQNCIRCDLPQSKQIYIKYSAVKNNIVQSPSGFYYVNKKKS